MKVEEYRGGWKIIATFRDAIRGPKSLTAAGDADAEEHMLRFPADILLTDRGVLVILKGEELNREQFLQLETTLSSEPGSLAPEQVQQARESILYDEVTEVRLSGGKPPAGLIAMLAGDKPLTRVWLNKKAVLGLSRIAVEFYAKLSADAVRELLQRTPLAEKIR